MENVITRESSGWFVPPPGFFQLKEQPPAILSCDSEQSRLARANAPEGAATGDGRAQGQGAMAMYPNPTCTGCATGFPVKYIDHCSYHTRRYLQASLSILATFFYCNSACEALLFYFCRAL